MSAPVPRAMVARVTAWRTLRSGVAWGCIFGIYVASSALGYASSYKTVASRERLASLFGSNAAIDALVGPARHIDTVAGFTAWRSLVILTVVGGLWGVLTSTRLVRGEEDAGRSELLLAGPVTRRGAAIETLAGLGAGLVALFAVTAAATVAVGRSSSVGIGAGAGLYFALCLVMGAAVFLALGATVSQLAPTRRQAAAGAGGVLGASFALRLVADSSPQLSFLGWVSPIGWVERLRPLASPDPRAFVALFGLIVVLVLATVALAERRDVGAAVLPERASRAPRTRLLSGQFALSVRLLRPSALAWGAGIAAGAALTGYIAKQAGKAISDSSSAGAVTSRLGAPGTGTTTYLGVAFLIVSLLIGLVAASQVSAARVEEAEGRLEHLVVRPVSRLSWLAGRVGLGVTLLVACGAAAGATSWLGIASQHSGLAPSRVLEAGLNAVAPGLCVLGIGVLAFGLRPALAAAASYGLLAWSFLVEILAGLAISNRWLLDTSLFHQLALAPATHPNWTTAGVLCGLGFAAAALGAVGFVRRDLVGD